MLHILFFLQKKSMFLVVDEILNLDDVQANYSSLL